MTRACSEACKACGFKGTKHVASLNGHEYSEIVSGAYKHDRPYFWDLLYIAQRKQARQLIAVARREAQETLDKIEEEQNNDE